MKVVLFFSRFAFICNIAFLLFVFFSWVEIKRPKAAGDRVLEISFVKELIITLGFTAILTNLVMNIIYAIFWSRGRLKVMPRWLIIANVLFLLLQFYYFFVFNF